jgi:P27 family predicted phage terminase small subunit
MEPGIPDPPIQLTPRALEEWNRLAIPLFNLGVMTKYDRAVFALYCQSWGRWQDAEEQVAAKGTVVKTQSGNIIQNPALAVSNRAAKDCIRYAQELGLTPSARSRIDTEGLNSRAAQDSGLAKFFG